MNRLLSKDRARSVLNYLGSKGIAGNRLQSDGFGPDKPIDTKPAKAIIRIASLDLEAASQGAWGNNLRARIDAAIAQRDPRVVTDDEMVEQVDVEETPRCQCLGRQVEIVGRRRRVA
jgi:hypothetical protein